MNLKVETIKLNRNFFVYADDHSVKGSGLAPWPARLTSPPPRLADFGYSNKMFEKDTVQQCRIIHPFNYTCYQLT